MSSEMNQPNVIEQIQNLEAAFNGEVASRKRMVRTTRIILLVLSFSILFFVLLNYFHFRFQWTKEKFKYSLEQEMRELSPVAMKELSAMGKDLLPVYAEEGKKQIHESMPEISQILDRELDRLSTDILENADHRLREMEESVLSRTEEVLLESYPGLKESAKRKELERRFHKETHDAVVSAVQEFDKLFSKDIEESRALLLKFDIKDTDESQVDLQKKFIRLWLQLLDLEIKEL